MPFARHSVTVCVICAGTALQYMLFVSVQQFEVAHILVLSLLALQYALRELFKQFITAQHVSILMCPMLDTLCYSSNMKAGSGKPCTYYNPH